MELSEIVRKVFQELLIPEFDIIKRQKREIRATLELINKRLEDMNGYFMDRRTGN